MQEAAESPIKTDAPKAREGQPTSVESRAKAVTQERKRKSAEMKAEGKTLQEMVTAFDNDYSALGDLYKEKTGVDLITDPFEALAHPLDITKSCSIVVPAYNSGKQLDVALHAIQASSFNAKYPDQLEVIIVDDESPTVDLAKLVREMELYDLSIKVIRQSNGRENKGRYSGVVEAEGDVVLFTSQDIVYSPTMIEEFMKRHEVLDDVTCFGPITEIDPNDPRLENGRIANGSLGELPTNMNYDFRIREDGLADSDWLKKGGNDKPLPISTNAEQSWSWHLRDLPWTASVSAPRDVLLKTMCSYDERYKGYGSDEGQLIADLIAEGLFVIPNTGGIAHHQTHKTRNNPEEGSMNEQVYKDNLSHPPRRQDTNTPKLTDAKVTFSARNIRTRSKESIGIPSADTYTRARTLFDMGLYDKAAELYAQVEGTDFWFIADKAAALVAKGGDENIKKAINDLEELRDIDPNVTWIHSRLALAYGRIGEYEKCRTAYEEAYKLDSNNGDAAIIAPLDQDPQTRAEEVKKKGLKKLVEMGKPREGLRYLEAAIALVGEEKQPWAVFDKGKALWQLGDEEGAIGQLQRARKLMPNETWVDSQIGLIYEKQGNESQARAYFSSALGKSADNDEAKKGIERIDLFFLNSSKTEQDLGLLDGKDYSKRYSSRLKDNPNANLDESTEITDYLSRLDPVYREELELMDQAIGRPMSPECRAVITIPAYEEEKTIVKTLGLFLNQRDQQNNPLNPNLFEIVIVDNHPEKVAKDGTEDVVKKFMEEHPQLRISYAHKAWNPAEKACVGHARKYTADISLLRANKRTSKTGDLVVVSFDADVDGVSDKYITDMVAPFDRNPKLDAIAGKFTLPESSLAKPNVKAAQQLWQILDRIIDQDAINTPQSRRPHVPKLVGRNAATRAATLAAIGGYNPNANVGEDMEIAWLINEARKRGDSEKRHWDEHGQLITQNRVEYINKAEVITNPRRFLASYVQGVPMVNMYDNFHEDRDVRNLDNNELLARIPDTFNVTEFEKQADALLQHYKQPQFGWIKDQTDAYFKRAMTIVGAEYEVVEGHIKITNTAKIEEKLREKNAAMEALKGAENEGIREIARGMLYRREYLEASEVLQDLYDKNPQDYWLAHDYGKALVGTNQREKVQRGRGILEKAAQSNPTETWVQSKIAIAYGRERRYDDCLRTYEKALIFNSGNDEAQIILPKFVNGKLETRDEQLERLHKSGQELLNKVINSSKTKQFDRQALDNGLLTYEAELAIGGGVRGRPWAEFDKGKLLKEAGRLEEATESFKSIKDIFPSLPYVSDELAEVTNKRQALSSPVESTIALGSTEAGVLPNLRQQNKIIAYFLRVSNLTDPLEKEKIRKEIIGSLTVSVSDIERSTYFQRIKSGEFKRKAYGEFLDSIAPSLYGDYAATPEALLALVQANPAYIEVIAASTRSERKQEALVTIDDIRTLTNKVFTNAVAFDAARIAFLANIPSADRARYDQAYLEVGRLVYGKQWEYMQQMYLLEQEAAKLDTTDMSVAIETPRRPDNMAKDMATLQAFSEKQTLESKESYETSLDEVLKVIEGHDGIAELKELPTLIIPDLHARRDFLYKALASTVKNGPDKGRTMYELLKEGKINIVCLGDGMHSERKEAWDYQNTPDGDAMWKKTYKTNELVAKEYRQTQPHLPYEKVQQDPRIVAVAQEALAKEHAFLDPEMRDSLGLMKMVMDLKAQFPDTFHYIRGNHDDILASYGNYMKYGQESIQTRQWIETNLGANFVNKLVRFEQALPLMVKNTMILATHATPALPLTEQEIRNRAEPKSLIWTENYNGISEAVATNVRTIKENVHLPENALWFVGHRTIPPEIHEGRYRELVAGQMFQINNKTQHVVAFVPGNGQPFNPATDIYKL